MKSRYLPGFDIAGANAGLLTAVSVPEFPYAENHRGKNIYLRKFQRDRLIELREFAGVVGNISKDELCSAVDPADWSSLARSLGDAIVKSVQPRLETYLKGSDSPVSILNLNNDAYSGAAQSIAFLEVIPRVLARAEFRCPGAEIAEVARKSAGFIIQSTGLTEGADMHLTYAIASPKPDPNEDYPYKDLRYDPKWFHATHNGAVGLNPEKVANMDGLYGQCPTTQARSDEIWFGCPARKVISPMFKAAISAAQESGLLENTYLTNRRNLGY